MVDLTGRFAATAENAGHLRDGQKQLIREVLHSAAVEIDKFVPEGREKSLAITKIEESMFWALAGLNRSTKPL